MKKVRVIHIPTGKFEEFHTSLPKNNFEDHLSLACVKNNCKISCKECCWNRNNLNKKYSKSEYIIEYVL